MNKQEEAAALINKYLEGNCTPEEKALVERFYLARFTESPLPDDMPNPRGIKAEIWKNVEAELSIKDSRKVNRLWQRIAAAASILLGLSAGGYFLLHKQAAILQTAQIQKQDIAPGGTHAILTLSNGRKIILDAQHKGKIASQGSAAVMLTENGSVAYQAAAKTAETIYNTLTIPIGNHRDITLSDGTEVSLDAGSSITYPVTFNRDKHEVTVTGQAYFKVKYDAAQPFFVKVKDLTLQDLGTEFNVNAYDDEQSVKTTLVEGSVKVNSTILKPGQQAVAKNENITVQPVDVEAVTAWKNNNFLFRNQPLQTTMREIARWYDVNIIYDNPPAGLRIYADISRRRNLSVLLNAIEQTGKVKFKIEGRNVHVTQ